MEPWPLPGQTRQLLARAILISHWPPGESMFLSRKCTKAFGVVCTPCGFVKVDVLDSSKNTTTPFLRTEPTDVFCKISPRWGKQRGGLYLGDSVITSKWRAIYYCARNDR
ncbi:hypothetical protein J3F84DRAFT_94519 [Trichoderma pleuroticola]